MTKAKIRSDEHGPYVRAGGYVFRPYGTQQTVSIRIVRDGNTTLQVGSEVRARHVPGTVFGSVTPASGLDVSVEYWASHGSYYDSEAKQIPSVNCWRLM